MFCSNQFLMGAVIKHFDLYYRTLSWRSIIVKLPPSPLFSLTGSKYTCSCYDSEYPPPLRAEASGRGMSFRFYSRQEPNQRMIGSAMYSLGQGIAHALTDGGHKWVLWSRNYSAVRRKVKKMQLIRETLFIIIEKWKWIYTFKHAYKKRAESLH